MLERIASSLTMTELVGMSEVATRHCPRISLVSNFSGMFSIGLGVGEVVVVELSLLYFSCLVGWFVGWMGLIRRNIARQESDAHGLLYHVTGFIDSVFKTLNRKFLPM